MAVFIRDPNDPWGPGKVACRALEEALSGLKQGLERLGVSLTVKKGKPLVILKKLALESGADLLVFNRLYEPYARRRDAEIEEKLGVPVKSFNASLLFEPWPVRTKSGGPFKVFTPFAKACRAAPEPETPIKAKKAVNPAEKTAQKRLRHFIDKILPDYHRLRDRPDKDGTSRLSTFLHFGMLGPRQVWCAVRFAMAARPEASAGGEVFLKELLWREFSYHLLFHFPDLPEKPLQKAFAKMPWRKDKKALEAWQRGRTGYPIVDAGMRQLLKEGWMHNRLRMIVASFLVKDLLLPWQEGAAWFWDKLNDADLANNAASWQWVAGCGADVAPFFRIFNPVTQGRKFDPDGAYIRRYVPELKGLKPPFIHEPWNLEGRDRIKNYPPPFVDHALARQRALVALKKTKKT